MPGASSECCGSSDPLGNAQPSPEVVGRSPRSDLDASRGRGRSGGDIRDRRNADDAGRPADNGPPPSDARREGPHHGSRAFEIISGEFRWDDGSERPRRSTRSCSGTRREGDAAPSPLSRQDPDAPQVPRARLGGSFRLVHPGRRGAVSGHRPGSCTRLRAHQSGERGGRREQRDTGAGSRRYRPRGRLARDGGQSTALQDARRRGRGAHLRRRTRPRNPGRYRAGARAEFWRHQLRGHRTTGVLPSAGRTSRVAIDPGLARRSTRYGDGGFGGPAQCVAAARPRSAARAHRDGRDGRRQRRDLPFASRGGCRPRGDRGL